MIYYTIDNITIGRFEAVLNDSHEIVRPLFRRFVPVAKAKAKANQLIEDFNKINNKEKNKISDHLYRISLINRVNTIYPAIYSGLKVCKQIEILTGQEPPDVIRFKELFKLVSLLEPTVEAIESIPNIVSKLIDRYEQVTTPENTNKAVDFDFTLFLHTIEKILSPTPVRTYKLKELHRLNDLALKLQTKQHGRDK